MRKKILWKHKLDQDEYIIYRTTRGLNAQINSSRPGEVTGMVYHLPYLPSEVLPTNLYAKIGKLDTVGEKLFRQILFAGKIMRRGHIVRKYPIGRKGMFYRSKRAWK